MHRSTRGQFCDAQSLESNGPLRYTLVSAHRVSRARGHLMIPMIKVEYYTRHPHVLSTLFSSSVYPQSVGVEFVS